MKTLREFAQFVGKPNDPISPRELLLDYLKLGISSNPLSLQELITAFDNSQFPLSIESVLVEPTSGVVPLQITIQSGQQKGYPLELRLQVLRNGQLIADYDGFRGQIGHIFSEAGTYTVQAVFRGIGSTGYAEAIASATVVAKPVPTTPPLPPPPPPSSTWRLSLRLAPSELVLSTLRIISAEWKVTPLWNPSQVFNLTGSNAENRFTAESNLPNPPNSGEQRVQAELRFRCAVAGVLDGIEFPYSEFDGIVSSGVIGWENKNLKAGWVAQYNILPDQTTGLFRVVVSASLHGIEPL